jgi:putative drug exporter of the RND superfamily
MLAPRRGQLAIVAFWIVTALAALPFALTVNNKLDASARLAGSESAGVELALQNQFESPFAKIVLLRVVGLPVPQAGAGREVLQRIVDAISATPGVKGVMSYLDREDSLFLGKDGSSIVIVGLQPAKDLGERAMTDLRATGETLRRQLKEYPTLDLRWTGEAAVGADMRRLSATEMRVAEITALPITGLLLLVAFRSIIAALLPIICGIVTIVISLGVQALLNRIWPASVIVVSIITMVGLGISIDYGLLMVSRYRDGLNAGLMHAGAVSEAARHSGRTVLVSGSAVAIGFGALLLVPVSEIRSIGMGGLLVAIVAAALVCTLLPVLLSWVGPWIDVGRLGRAISTSSGRRWRAWAVWITRRPLIVLSVTVIPLLWLAAQSIHLRLDLPRGRWLPDSAESVHVLHDIDSVARGNFAQIIHVVLQLPPGVTIQQEAGWRAESRLVRYFARDPRVQHVWSVTTLNIKPLGGPELLATIPQSARANFVTADGRAALIELLPREGLAATDAAKLVREIRAMSPETLTGIAGASFALGGVPAFNVDYEDAIRHSLPRIGISVIAATLLVLAVAFRSVLIPIKAVALNLLSVAAAFGAVTMVFQSSVGSSLMGLPRPLDGGFPILPVLVFCIVFGLSMDYEVFLVARIADGRRSGFTDHAAVVEGLAGTARVISFAASIMMVIFGAFVFGDFVVIKLLGFALGMAVFVDATVIRLALGPALIQLAGRWNWWPGPRAKAARDRV